MSEFFFRTLEVVFVEMELRIFLWNVNSLYKSLKYDIVFNRFKMVFMNIYYITISDRLLRNRKLILVYFSSKFTFIRRKTIECV